MAEAAREWRRSNEEAEALLRRLSPRVLSNRALRGDMRRSPRRAAARARVDRRRPGGPAHASRRGTYHVVGNGMRLDSTREIRLDDRWRTALGADDLATFDAVAGDLTAAWASLSVSERSLGPAARGPRRVPRRPLRLRGLDRRRRGTRGGRRAPDEPHGALAGRARPPGRARDLGRGRRGRRDDRRGPGAQGLRAARTAGPGLRFVHPRWTSLCAALARADARTYYHNCARVRDRPGGLVGAPARRRFVFSTASDMDCDPALPDLREWRERWLYRYGLRRARPGDRPDRDAGEDAAAIVRRRRRTPSPCPARARRRRSSSRRPGGRGAPRALGRPHLPREEARPTAGRGGGLPGDRLRRRRPARRTGALAAGPARASPRCCPTSPFTAGSAAARWTTSTSRAARPSLHVRPRGFPQHLHRGLEPRPAGRDDPRSGRPRRRASAWASRSPAIPPRSQRPCGGSCARRTRGPRPRPAARRHYLENHTVDRVMERFERTRWSRGRRGRDPLDARVGRPARPPAPGPLPLPRDAGHLQRPRRDAGRATCTSRSLAT